MITSKEIVNLETRINALLFSFQKLKRTRREEKNAYFKEVKSMSRSIYTLMNKLATADDRLKNRKLLASLQPLLVFLNLSYLFCSLESAI